MPLINNSLELKEWFSGIEKDYNFNSIVSFRNDAEDDYIIPEVGRGIYDALIAARAAATEEVPMDPKMLVVYRYLQKASVHLSLMLSADSGAFQISDSGFYISSSADKKAVSDKKMSEFRKGRREAGYKALEQAIDYLEANINHEGFEAYKSSDQHTSARAFFINNAKDFTRWFRAINNSVITFRAMLDGMDRAERDYILPVLGEPLYAALKSAILDGTLSVDQRLLLPYIQRPLAYLTVGESIPALPIEFNGTNLFLNNSPAYGNSEQVEGKEPVKENRLSVLMNTCIMTGNKELERLRTYLNKNAGKHAGYEVNEILDEDLNVNNQDRGTLFV